MCGGIAAQTCPDLRGSFQGGSLRVRRERDISLAPAAKVAFRFVFFGTAI